MKNIHDRIPGYLRILRPELVYPVGMFLKQFILTDIHTGKNRLRKLLHLILQSGRKNRQSHNFNQTDIFLLDMMQLRVRMIDTKRMLLGRDIVAQHQIQFELISSFSGNRGNRVMRLTVRLSINKYGFIRINPPCIQDHICQCDQPVRICSADTDHRHRPVHDTCLHVFKSLHGKASLDPGPCHGELIVASLKMVMA